MDQQGRRHTVKAMEGQSLIDVLVDNKDEIGIEESSLTTKGMHMRAHQKTMSWRV
jgi:hypothetical protein